MNPMDDILKMMKRFVKKSNYTKVNVKLTPEEISDVEQLSIKKISIERRLDDIKLEADILNNDKRLWWQRIERKYNLSDKTMTYDNGKIMELVNDDED